jgi:hypothetical protein
MSKNRLIKDEIRAFILEQKIKLDQEQMGYSPDPKGLANKYINIILDKVEEYRC